MKSWVSSAFTDSSISTAKPTRCRTSVQKPSSQKESSQKQTLSNLTNKKLREIIAEPFNPVNQNTQNSTSLANKYEPENRSELSVHKNKIEQLSNLLDDCLIKNKGSIILIEGPSGCGKFVTLKVLCKEKNVELVEWDQNNLNLKSFDLQNQGDYAAPYESQIKKFTQFLFKSSRYESNQLFGQANTSHLKKILLVKELPNFAFKDVQVFLNLLQEFKRFSRFSLVFTLTQTHSTDLNPHRIFSADTRKNLRVLEISFNSIANTYMSKKIDKIAKLERFGFADKKFLENV
ncbi:cell cycle checkpoint RAD17 isoform X2, partial [Brachionus plicatilis]